MTFIENNKHIPFEIKRIYYLYNVPYQESRGAHAHKELQQLILPICGSFTVGLDDGYSRRSFVLKDKHVGLYICPMIWRDIADFSSGAVCLVLASHDFEESDYFRSYDEFVSAVRRQ